MGYRLPLDSLPWTKPEDVLYSFEPDPFAERDVLAANGPELATVALRPHLIWGPGDNHLVPRLLARARTGKLKIVGDGRNRVDVTYVDNAAEAHRLALDRLAPRSPIAGRAYFISQGEPVELWPFINRILASVDLPPITRRVPFRIAFAAGAVLEKWFRLRGRTDEPPMTRFVAAQLAHSHWFDIAAAKRDLGYSPTVSITEGLEKIRAGKFV
jgi:nucleoside-diphosphate-sugar epimerase